MVGRINLSSPRVVCPPFPFRVSESVSFARVFLCNVDVFRNSSTLIFVFGPTQFASSCAISHCPLCMALIFTLQLLRYLRAAQWLGPMITERVVHPTESNRVDKI